MTSRPSPPDPQAVVDAVQVTAGIVAARHRGDDEAAQILAEGQDPSVLLAGALLLVEVSSGMYAILQGQDPASTLSELSVEIERSILGR